MRQIATFEDERSARHFADVLCAREIDTEVSRAREGAYTVWVLDESDLEASRAAYAAFDANPDAPEHAAALGCIEKKQRASVAVERKSRHEVINVRSRWGRGGTGGPPRVTLALIVASVLVTAVVNLLHREDVVALLSIGSAEDVIHDQLFYRVLHGEVWRLVTPIFIHFGILHIVFNMWWLLDLGAAIESRIGSLRFTGLVLVTGVLSNVVQYLWKGPMFGGMSGVLYALFGYVWVRGRMDRTLGLMMPPNTATILLVWLGLGFVGVLGNVANGAHLAGLAAGAAAGYLAAFRAAR